jgi:hypothetical protein
MMQSRKFFSTYFHDDSKKPHKNISSKLTAVVLIKHRKSAIELIVTKYVCHVSHFRRNNYHLWPVLFYHTFFHYLTNYITFVLKRRNAVIVVVSGYDVVSPLPHC